MVTGTAWRTVSRNIQSLANTELEFTSTVIESERQDGISNLRFTRYTPDGREFVYTTNLEGDTTSFLILFHGRMNTLKMPHVRLSYKETPPTAVVRRAISESSWSEWLLKDLALSLRAAQDDRFEDEVSEHDTFTFYILGSLRDDLGGTTFVRD